MDRALVQTDTPFAAAAVARTAKRFRTNPMAAIRSYSTGWQTLLLLTDILAFFASFYVAVGLVERTLSWKNYAALISSESPGFDRQAIGTGWDWQESEDARGIGCGRENVAILSGNLDMSGRDKCAGGICNCAGNGRRADLGRGASAREQEREPDDNPQKHGSQKWGKELLHGWRRSA